MRDITSTLMKINRPNHRILYKWTLHGKSPSISILNLSDQHKLQVSNYIFQLLHSNIDEEIDWSLLFNNQIHSHNTRNNNQMSILRVNGSKTRHCVLHNGMITRNSLPDIFKINVYFSMFKSKNTRKY